MIFLLFSKSDVLSICERRKYNVALYILHAIEYATSKTFIKVVANNSNDWYKLVLALEEDCVRL